MTSRRARAFVAMVLLLGLIASVTSRLRLPDSFFYTDAEAARIIPGCAEIHCFRVLVPWTLGVLPGSSVVKWKAYAVLANAAAGIAVFDLSLVLGLTVRTAAIAMALSAFGFGSLLTMFEPYTSDPLMFWLSPVVTRLAIDDRAGLAAGVAAIGVFAKEFIVAALGIPGLMFAAVHQWARARRIVAAAAAAFVVWLAVQAWLRLAFGYSYGPNRSPKLTAGSYLYVWLSNMSARGALSAMYNEFGAVYLLAPAGWLAAPPLLRRLALAAVPVAVVFAYVQQPDRALYNFHYLTSPLAAIALGSLSNGLVGLFLALYIAANMKVGGQVAFMPQARYAFALTAVLAVAAIVAHRRGSGSASAETLAGVSG